MANRIFAFSIALLASALLSAQVLALKPIIEPLENGWELSVDNVTFPSTETGTVRLKTCDDCDTQTVRITGQSKAYIGKLEVGMGAFKQAVADNPSAQLLVFVRINTDEVSRVILAQ